MNDAFLREHVLYLLGGGGAHLDLNAAVAGLPAKLRGVRPPGLTVTPWGLLEHIRIAQWDILEFTRNPAYRSPEWPEGYWPASDAPPSAAAWNRSVAAYRADLEAMKSIVADPAVNLFAPIPHGKGQTVLREALLIADHTAYHLGQMVTLRRLLGAWPKD